MSNYYSRREFLKFSAFLAGSAALVSACRQPVRKAIPYFIQPEEIVPGEALYYASTYYDGNEYNSILLKVRDGRPIKIEGNDLSTISKGATSARVQASILSLYDPDRIMKPLIKQNVADWEEVNKQIIEKLNEIRSNNKKLAIISHSIISPSFINLLEEFKKVYPNSELVIYDNSSSEATAQAHSTCFGRKEIPSFHLDKVTVMVAFNADFLSTWLSPLEFSNEYAKKIKNRADDRATFYHFHFESGTSLTGLAADSRFAINPSDELNYIAELYNLSIKKKIFKTNLNPEIKKSLKIITDLLNNNKRKSLLVSGTDDYRIQLLIAHINYNYGNYGSVIDFSRAYHAYMHKESVFTSYLNDNPDEIGGVIFMQTNPVYDFPGNHQLQELLEKTDFSVAISSFPNETTAKCNFVCPENYFPESWADAEFKTASFSLGQPVINRIFDTRQSIELFSEWMGNPQSAEVILKNYWERNIFERSESKESFDEFWLKSLQKGVVELAVSDTPDMQLIPEEKSILNDVKISQHQGLEIYPFESAILKNGYLCNNAWLQECPDPFTKISYDNCALVSDVLAKELELKTGDIIQINNMLEIPVFVSSLQAEKTIAIAKGYGHSLCGSIASEIGQNVKEVISDNNSRKIFISKTDRKTEFAFSQKPMDENKYSVAEMLFTNGENPEKKPKPSFYQKYEHKIHYWSMAIDLETCTGCSACVVACQCENNIPVVGKNEIRRGHDMYWMRIDRYFHGGKVVFQPVNCQHCGAAPCENVCPVSATIHSSEGINQMIYNRCIGTRYCNNNCPYKVRRFNWFDYNSSDIFKNNDKSTANNTKALPRMVLNPDVTIRTKGVIEKCSMCFQRIVYVKNKAKAEKRAISDGEILPACAQSCPSQAIVFGDLNDKNSRIFKLLQSNRAFHFLDELNTLPSVFYLKKKMS
jgi:molybdopterin-containing oxidoreductase family iron-sulfur binding subunit